MVTGITFRLLINEVLSFLLVSYSLALPGIDFFYERQHSEGVRIEIGKFYYRVKIKPGIVNTMLTAAMPSIQSIWSS